MAANKPLVCVKWLDAHGSGLSAFAEHEIPHAGVEITTYGLLIREDSIGVTVAGEYCADGTYRACTFVPAAMIIEVKPIIKARKKRLPAEVTPVEG